MAEDSMQYDTISSLGDKSRLAESLQLGQSPSATQGMDGWLRVSVLHGELVLLMECQRTTRYPPSDRSIVIYAPLWKGFDIHFGRPSLNYVDY